MLLFLFLSFFCLFVQGLQVNVENAFIAHKIESACSLEQSFDYLHQYHGAKQIFTFNIPNDDYYVFLINYMECLENTNSPIINIKVNGHVLPILKGSEENEKAESTGMKIRKESIPLRFGLNTIALEMQEGSAVRIFSVSVIGALPLADRGATLNYFEVEAEDSLFSGTVIGPNRTYLSIPAEASGRRAVVLSKSGDFVNFTLSQSTNAMVVRFSIPNSESGRGLWTGLQVYINNELWNTLNLTSVYTWIYGTGNTKNPSDGGAHHFFDDVRTQFGKTLPPGTTVRLQAQSTDLEVTIDVVDFYIIPEPYTQPATGYLSVLDFGADPSGKEDSLSAFNTALYKASNVGYGVWIPEGQFLLSTIWLVNNITVRGAGPWYTEIHGHNTGIYGGVPANQSSSVEVYDLAIFGTTVTRNSSDASSGFGGSLADTIIQNVWVEHSTTGFWINGPLDALIVSGCTIRNTWADGINFHQGVINSMVEQSVLRNLGDDGLAMWAQLPNRYGANIFRFNTVQLPILANTIAVYGGADNTVTDNVVLDTVNYGGGIQVGTRFGSTPLFGTTVVARNTLIRTGSTGLGQPNSFGAIWVYSDVPISANLELTDNIIIDSFSSAIQLYDSPVTNAFFGNITIDTSPYAIEIDVTGASTFQNVIATNVEKGLVKKANNFTIIDAGGNQGWLNITLKK